MSHIRINHLSYAVPNDKVLFQQLSLTFGAEKTGLVGLNGVGKSSLLRLIMNELMPDSGTVITQGNIAYCPQTLEISTESSVSEMLTEKELAKAGLAYLDGNRLFHSLSGGEKTRVVLSKPFSENADFIILDEPTNNLDADSRQFLYHTIQQWRGGLLVVSHDRTLLNLMDRMIELSSLGAQCYGGNYDNFVQQKSVIHAANERQLFDAKKQLHKTFHSAQQNLEKSEQKKSYGRKRFLTGKVDKLTANSKKGRSEKTQQRHAKLNENLVQHAEEQLECAKSKIEINKEIHLDLPRTTVPNGKTVLKITDLTFGYTDNSKTIINNFNLSIVGPERIALLGNNGSGKTTLIKLILEELKADCGEIYRGVEYVSYLDQSISQLNPEISLLDNFIQLNPRTNETDARRHLANFLFRKASVLKIVKNLSGGEKLRALLACILMSQHPPQLLILDEPTNHLDLDSIAAIESALENYQGAMIIISHDQRFLDNINVQRFIPAPFIS